MSKNFIERFNQESIGSPFWNANKKICAALAVCVLAVIMINTTGCTNNGNDDVAVNLPQEDNVVKKETVKVGNDGVNAAIAPDENVTKSEVDKKETTDSMVAMSVEDFGRSDPFLPSNEVAIISKSSNKSNFDLVPPPNSLIVDPTAVDVVSTKVSGIMYDKFNPSAILNISGSDYLVRTGDVINSYKILSIGKENVTVQYGANVYKAGVGELFSGDGINYNTISNLDRKFGGNKNVVNKR